MKDDLIKILNFKLKHITENIDELNTINGKIDDVNANLKYIQKTIENFKGEEHGFDIYKFAKIDRETFNKLLMELSDEVLVKFGTSSCNYDGLIYLINGINNGISLTLTQEQVEAINLFIDKLLEKEKEYQESINSLNTDKQKLEVQDLDVLKELENKYSMIIENIEDKKYVTEIDDIVGAILYSELSSEKTFDILRYLLNYNSEIYAEEQKELKAKIMVKDEKRENDTIDLTKPFEIEDDKKTEIQVTEEETIEEEPINLINPIEDDKQTIVVEVEESVPEEVSLDEEMPKLDLSFEKTMELPTFDYLSNSINLASNDKIPDVLTVTNVAEENLESAIVTNEQEEMDETLSENQKVMKSVNEYDPVLPSFENAPLDEKENDENNNLNNLDNAMSELSLPEEDFSNEELTLPEEEMQNFEDEEESLGFEKNSFNEVEQVKEESSKIDELELKDLLNNYHVDYESIDDVTKMMLRKGNLDEYREILVKLEELDILNYLQTKQGILVQILLYSNVEILDEVSHLIEENLLIDKEDKKYTMDLVIKTMPTVFLKSENGNYANFVKNLELFKEYGIDLINLFYFARELFIADPSLIVKNHNIVKSYDLTVNAQNAKYLLLLPNISEKIDYFVEAVYKDNSKEGRGETFDGMDLVKLYPNKLNVVAKETIKRLRYSSENEKKVFGSKEKSLAGEITNLKIDVINMPLEYTSKFFNNEFDVIARDEVEQFVKMVNANEYQELVLDDTLNKLEVNRNGLRYEIEGINVSRNKVIRNYNILIKNGVAKEKALLFAVCYNLVITKEEYGKVKNFVNSLGGN